jgi:hypothetical protein
LFVVDLKFEVQNLSQTWILISSPENKLWKEGSERKCKLYWEGTNFPSLLKLILVMKWKKHIDGQDWSVTLGFVLMFPTEFVPHLEWEGIPLDEWEEIPLGKPRGKWMPVISNSKLGVIFYIVSTCLCH